MLLVIIIIIFIILFLDPLLSPRQHSTEFNKSSENVHQPQKQQQTNQETSIMQREIESLKRQITLLNEDLRDNQKPFLLAASDVLNSSYHDQLYRVNMKKLHVEN